MEILIAGSILALCAAGYGLFNLDAVARTLWGQHLTLDGFIEEAAAHHCSPIVISIDLRYLTAMSAFAPVPAILGEDTYYYVVLETVLPTGHRIYYEELAAFWHNSTLESPTPRVRTSLDCRDEAVRRAEELGKIAKARTQSEIRFDLH